MFFVSALLILAAGCSSAPTQPAVKPTLPDMTEQEEKPPEGISPQAVPPEAGGANIIVPEPKPVMSGNRAVIALLDRAQFENEAGRRGAAGTSLERALRIEPRNPWLWHELAQLRLTQGQYLQAISLAKKSISFARDERRLQAMNWHLIGNARVAQGDSTGAEDAFKLATVFEQEK